MSRAAFDYSLEVNYVKDFGSVMPVWGFSESPLVEGDKIICTPGAADAVLMALDKRTGKPIWKCAFPEGEVSLHCPHSINARIALVESVKRTFGRTSFKTH